MMFVSNPISSSSALPYVSACVLFLCFPLFKTFSEQKGFRGTQKSVTCMDNRHRQRIAAPPYFEKV